MKRRKEQETVWGKREAMLDDLEFEKEIGMLARYVNGELLVKHINICIIYLRVIEMRGKSKSKNTQECDTRGKQVEQWKRHYWRETWREDLERSPQARKFTSIHVQDGKFQVVAQREALGKDKIMLAMAREFKTTSLSTALRGVSSSGGPGRKVAKRDR